MVVVSHDREFLDQLCNKLVETEQGVATSYKGNYTEYVKAKEEKIGQQWAAWEKQQKEIARQVGKPPPPPSPLHCRQVLRSGLQFNFCICAFCGIEFKTICTWGFAEVKHAFKVGT